MATDTSKTSGDWNAASTWSKGEPNANSSVDITARKTVTLDQAPAHVSSVTVAARGALDIEGQTLTTTAGTTVHGEILGAGVIQGDVEGDGTVLANGGVLDLKGPVDSQGAGLDLRVAAGATLKLEGAVGAQDSLLTGESGTTVTFSGHGVLDLTAEGAGGNGEMSAFQAYVENFAAGDKIEVAGSGHAGDKVLFNPRTDVLTVTNAAGHVLEQVTLDGDYSHAKFSLAQSGGVDAITVNAICFLAGTRIRTLEGEVAVETLKRGDLVMTTDGIAKPVRWLGRQTISTLFSDPRRAWPVRVRAGALAHNMPSRDLVLSPDHALLVDGVLIQANALVNGTSVTREFTMPKTFVYYHVELDDHSLIFAENTPAETFIDNADRLAFDNWDEHEALYPTGKALEEMPYARAKGPRQTPIRIRVAIAERARKLGLLTAEVA